MRPLVKFSKHSLLKWTESQISRYDLLKNELKAVDQTKVLEGSKMREREIQIKRQRDIYMVYYSKEILIPSDPSQDCPSIVSRSPFSTINLDDLHQRFQRSKQDLRVDLETMLDLEKEFLQGGFQVYQSNPEKIFKNIKCIDQTQAFQKYFQFLKGTNPNSDLIKLRTQVLLGSQKSRSDPYEQACQSCENLDSIANLAREKYCLKKQFQSVERGYMSMAIVKSIIQIWNLLIQPSEFQFFE